MGQRLVLCAYSSFTDTAEMKSLLPSSAALDSDKTANPNNNPNNKLHVLELVGTEDVLLHHIIIME